MANGHDTIRRAVQDYFNREGYSWPPEAPSGVDHIFRIAGRLLDAEQGAHADTLAELNGLREALKGDDDG